MTKEKADFYGVNLKVSFSVFSSSLKITPKIALFFLVAAFLRCKKHSVSEVIR